MNLFTLEHSKTAYQADLVFYSVAVVGVATWLMAGGPRAQWVALAVCVLVGAAAWTAMEYGAHRFVLHGIRPFSRWHALHHRRGEWPAYYGVTTSFWDHMFGSVQTPCGPGPTGG
jgi:sterol desaturase/sphingolipid hydroxylase (fatty acid hydroxylase superfamily)